MSTDITLGAIWRPKIPKTDHGGTKMNEFGQNAEAQRQAINAHSGDVLPPLEEFLEQGGEILERAGEIFFHHNGDSWFLLKNASVAVCLTPAPAAMAEMTVFQDGAQISTSTVRQPGNN